MTGQGSVPANNDLIPEIVKPGMQLFFEHAVLEAQIKAHLEIDIFGIPQDHWSRRMVDAYAEKMLAAIREESFLTTVAKL